MDTFVKSGGAWRTAKNVYVKAGGAWRTCQKVFVRRSGVWSQVFAVGAPVAPTSEIVSGTTAARVSFKYDGTYDGAIDGGLYAKIGDWYLPNQATTGWYVKFVRASGDVLTEGSEGVWYSIDSANNFGYSGVGAGNIKEGTFTVSISPDGVTTAVTSAVGAFHLIADHT